MSVQWPTLYNFTRVKLDLDFAKYLNTPGYYKDHFKLDVAKFLGIDKDRVIIFNSYQFGGDGTLTVPSGTVFDLYIENDPDLALARSLRTKMQDGSVTISYAQVRQVVICKDDACEKEWGNPVELFRNG